MTISNILGSLGVSLLLVAFVLNLRGLTAPDNRLYRIGAALFGYYSYLISFYPFIILESVWVVAAASSLFKSVSRETLGN